ncbi:MAG: hypothetical protein ACLQVL_12565 [Terriglobia bacterium]
MNYKPEATNITSIDAGRKKDKPQDIRDRAFQYALRAIKLYQHLQNSSL